MQPYLAEQFYNPSSAYTAARTVRKAYEEARESLAWYIGAKPQEIVLTAGATESVNLAFQGVMAKYPKGHIALSAIEHQAALATAMPYDHTLMPVPQSGMVSPEVLSQAVNDATVLVSVGYVNSEIGVVQPLRKLARAVADIKTDRARRGIEMPLYVHTDASQAAGMLDVHANHLGVDMMTLSASKIYGPKQVGLLFAKTGVGLEPLVRGGGQERGLRSGTENVAGAIGFAKALELVQQNRQQQSSDVKKLRDECEAQIAAGLPDAVITAQKASRAPHISHFSVPGIDAETLLFMLDEQGIMVATGAACAANRQTASHVLQAIGYDGAMIQGSVRCSFMHTLTEADIAHAAKQLVTCVKTLRKGS